MSVNTYGHCGWRWMKLLSETEAEVGWLACLMVVVVVVAAAVEVVERVVGVAVQLAEVDQTLWMRQSMA